MQSWMQERENSLREIEEVIENERYYGDFSELFEKTIK